MGADDISFHRQAVRPMECLRQGWQLIKDDYWLFLGISLVGILVGSMAPLALLMGPAMCGIHLCLLRKLNGQRVSFDLLFKGFDYFLESLIATLIMVVPTLIFTMILYLLFFVGTILVIGMVQPQGGPPEPLAIWLAVGMIGLGVLTLLVFSALVWALFLFVYPLIVERELKGVAAVRLSIRAALANFGGLVGLSLLTMLLSLAGMLLCYVGAIFVIPITLAASVMAYRQVFPVETIPIVLPVEAEG